MLSILYRFGDDAKNNVDSLDVRFETLSNYRETDTDIYIVPKKNLSNNSLFEYYSMFSRGYKIPKDRILYHAIITE